ncbi:alanine racemase [Simiduia agarivorans]|uniref:Alanine racemase n=1 Tax=Simiduia agarivorans (strain DSM 21679 / JCM 13881 / BCRC 17597 / SA1) TaxID=1117647 RepID=K4KLT5_SIMAS|nr:alanine racemase [Simiduia agarivorans]AFU99038.1 alanine racemase [Simiduia agarivorans SA1 = DSM 21679]
MHDGILTIDLDAIVANWRQLAARVAPSVCAAVVKANAYGLGMVPVSQALWRAGCANFFVATTDEGLLLREALPQARIVVLGGVRPGREQGFVEAGLWPSLFSLDAIERWLVATAASGTSAPCVINLNSGMTRLGMSPQELQRFIESADAERLDVKIFMSHLACADEPGHPLNQQQLTQYSQLVPAVKARWPEVVLSFANSSGIFLGQEFHFDLARPGAAMYGVNPTPALPNPMRPVVSLRLPVIQYRTITEPSWVGYSATVQVQAGQRLAVVLGGYADGLLRRLSNRGEGELAGHRVPIIGRVSMDATIFDVSAIPEAQLPPIGEAWVDMLSPVLDVNLVAEHMNTIGYEVLTNLGSRYHRNYVGGAS